VLLVDEAHLLTYEQLEELRLLTNADMDAHSPFALLLLGQPTLRRKLKLGTLAQRIALRYELPGMDPAETSGYIHHHLALAGRSDPCSPTTRSRWSTTRPAACPGRSTTSPSKPWWPPSPKAKQSSTRPAPAPP
jgi:type II secretory pathway predicted ATPase ExeA